MNDLRSGLPALQATPDTIVGRAKLSMQVESNDHDPETDTCRVVLIEESLDGLGTRIVVEGSPGDTEAFVVGRLFIADIELTLI